jgi:hypothetical protein
LHEPLVLSHSEKFRRTTIMNWSERLTGGW